MKIAIVITRGDVIGGASVHVRDMAFRFVGMGYDVFLIAGGYCNYWEPLIKAGARYIRLDSMRREPRVVGDVNAYLKMVKLFQSIKPEIACLHTSKAGFIGRLAAFRLNIPTVYNPHCWAFDENISAGGRWLYKSLESLLIKNTGRVINVSEYDRQQALRAGVGKSASHIVIHNGIEDIPAELHARQDSETPMLVMTARFEPQKDHKTLLKAMSKISSLNWMLTLVGDGSELANCISYANELGIIGRVNFLGHRSDVEEILSRAQIYVLASNWEGFPISILEAMRASLPVVATDVGGVSEAIQEEVNGYLVPKWDADLLSRRLASLIVSPHLRAQMGATGRAIFVEQFMFDTMFERTHKVYAELISAPKSL